MVGEKRTEVNIRHLLEDLRDAYPMGSTEEVVLTELVSNALDAGAGRIEFDFDRVLASVSVVDDGRGMTWEEFVKYHDIAESGKGRGSGIGFAGVGAKLALLISRAVYTETVGPDGKFAAVWRLLGDRHAVWREVPPLGRVKGTRGTAVELRLVDPNSPLLDSEFVSQKLLEHFLPFFVPGLHSFLQRVYGRVVSFRVGRRIPALSKGHPLAEGTVKELDEGAVVVSRRHRGEPEFYLCTHGKVILRGWESLGVAVEGLGGIIGIAEVPGLVRILSLNKCDVLRDKESLRVFRKLRKAVGQAVLRLLEEMGVLTRSEEGRSTDLVRELSQIFSGLVKTYPELKVLFGRDGGLHRSYKARVFRKSVGLSKGTPAVSSGLAVEFGSLGEEVLSAVISRKVILNKDHPALKRARAGDAEGLASVVGMACALSRFVDRPYDLIEDALKIWGRGKRR